MFFPLGSRGIQNVCLSVCVSVSLSVCLSVTATMWNNWPWDPRVQALTLEMDFSAKSISSQGFWTTIWNNFWPQGQIVVKFSESTKLIASNFWAGDLDPAARRGQSQTPKTDFSAQSISSQGFVKQEDKAKKCWEQNFDFWPSAGENGAGRWGYPGGTKILEFSIFLW